MAQRTGRELRSLNLVRVNLDPAGDGIGLERLEHRQGWRHQEEQSTLPILRFARSAIRCGQQGDDASELKLRIELQATPCDA